MTTVSVIIPAYNGDRFIAEAIQSVLMQTYADWELIVVDDGSSDRTAEIVQHYIRTHPQHIRYVPQANQGVAAARNRGFILSHGKYIAFLDQDDIWYPQKLEIQAHYLDKYPEIDIVHSGWQRINEFGDKIVDVEPWHNAPNLDLHEWLQWMPVLLSAMLFRRHCIEDVGGFDVSFKQVCDADLVQQLALQGCKTAWIKQILTEYRQHDRNDSLNTLQQAQESWVLRNKFFAQPSLPESVKSLERRYRYYLLIWIAWRLFITNQLRAMIIYLTTSLLFSDFPSFTTILSWSKTFSRLSFENGYNVADLISLYTSEEWNLLVGIVLRYTNSNHLQEPEFNHENL